MRYGQVLRMGTKDNGYPDVIVSVDFKVRRSVVYEFMDMIIPADGEAVREPIAAILDHSAEDVEWAIPEEDMRRAVGMAPIEKEDAEQKKSGTAATDDLKPCPFCGGNARLTVWTPTAASVSCIMCSAHFNTYTEAEAIKAWNRRADDGRA